MRARRLGVIAVLLVPLPGVELAVGQSRVEDAARQEFFEARIRPVLVEHCYSCHNSAQRARGGLELDHREGIRAESDSGTTVVPGVPGESLLLKVLRHEIEDLEMPEDGARLADEVVADFEQWIRDGAHDPRDAAPTKDELVALTSWEATLARRKEWWSLQPIRSVEPPQATSWSNHPLDRFVQREHERLGLERSEAASRRTLLRRASYVLTGLPPTPEELEAFMSDASPDAFERQIERLLASPHYGERWARHWMDLVRYADSHGSEGDPNIPYAWRYRDYLIRAFNQDVPYDQLLREHVAGDLLPEPRIDRDSGLDESAIGTAHWRLVFHGFTPTDALDEKARFVDDQINVFGKAFLAQTISCARCHDHKFDAISQKDYYSLYGVLASCRPGMQDVNSAEVQTQGRHELRELKKELRGSLAEVWKRDSASRVAQLTDLPSALEEAARRIDHPLHLLVKIDEQLRAGIPFASAWATARSTVQVNSTQAARRWDLTNERGLQEWFAFGNGLTDALAPAGAFAVESEGERLLTGIYPAGVYTHLDSTRHRGVLQSARFDLEGEYDVWFRVRGAGGAKLRYAVQDYPRGGTVYPIAEIESADWTWQRLDLSYWTGDSVHLELYTGLDAPIEVGSEERSWFGVREVRLVPTGSAAPVDPRFSLAASIGTAVESRAALARVVEQRIREAIDAWAHSNATDEQALLLDACLQTGVLENRLDELPELQGQIATYRAREARVPLPTRVPGLFEADAADSPLFVRGDHRRPGAPVRRAFLEVIDSKPYESTNSGRLELAEDLLRSDNPLTARVIVNRLWHHAFGRGIVATPDNFGRLGAEPTHPELLDYLAQRMLQEDWSIKALLRFMLTSKTWQLSSSATERSVARDPENLWLARAPLRRLDAESLRDSLFAATGLLDKTMYGPGFDANTLEGRRSVYVRSKRNSLDAFLEAFDAPVPFSTTGARSSTNVPAQSLAMLNGDLVESVAARWADDFENDARGAPQDERLSHLFEAVTGREPSKEEFETLGDYADELLIEQRDALERRRDLRATLADAEAELADLLQPVRDRISGEVRATLGTVVSEPVAQWNFREGLDDAVGDLDVQLHGAAVRTKEGLVLNGAGYGATSALAYDLFEKTLEVLVTLADLEQRGGGVVSVQNLSGDVFDAIVFGEESPRHWLAGSNHFARTQPFAGFEEQEAREAPVHLALVYDQDGWIRLYRNGVLYGSPYRKDRLVHFRAGDSQVLFGLRHGEGLPGRLLKGVIHGARLYGRALSALEVEGLASGTDRLSRARTLEHLPTEQRATAMECERRIAAIRSELDALDEAGQGDSPWARVAHALFNLKEFLYVP